MESSALLEQEIQIDTPPEAEIEIARSEIALAPTPIENHPLLAGKEANCEKSIMHLLDAPGFAYENPRASETFADLVDLKGSGWDKAKTRLKEHEIISLEIEGNRTNVIRLNPESLVASSRQHPFISVRALEKLRDNIGKTGMKAAQLESLEISLDHAIKDNVIQEAPEWRELEDAKLLASNKNAEETQQKIAQLVLENTLPEQSAEVRSKDGAGIMNFVFRSHDRLFFDDYDWKSFANLYPLHKALLDIGNLQEIDQTPKKQREHVLRIINKNVAKTSRLSNRQLGYVLRGAVEMGLLGDDGKYCLEAKAIDFLEAMKKSKPSQWGRT